MASPYLHCILITLWYFTHNSCGAVFTAADLESTAEGGISALFQTQFSSVSDFTNGWSPASFMASCRKNSTDNSKRAEFMDRGSPYARLFGMLPDFLQELIVFLLDNPFVGVVGMGSLVALVKQMANAMYGRLYASYTTSLEVRRDQPAYQWLTKWLHAKDWGTCTHVIVINNSTTDDFGNEQDSFGQKNQPEFQLVPNISEYGFTYKGYYITVNRKSKDGTEDRNVDISGGGLSSSLPPNLVLNALGTKTAIFQDLLLEAHAFYEEHSRKNMSVYSGRYGNWNCTASRRKRPIESVILDGDIAARLLGDLEAFISDYEWYLTTGVPYRRGYLLYGPPGCGKSSIIAALAGHLNYGISIIHLSDKFLSDETLCELCNSVPAKTILLLEDIDAAFRSREPPSTADPDASTAPATAESNGTNSGISFSGLLNALDGVATADGRILFMTTNYVDRLDPALVRPGRVDLKMHIGYCTQVQIEAMFKKFYRNTAPELMQAFVDRLKLDTGVLPSLTPAELQGHFLIYRASAQTAIDNVDKLLEASQRQHKETANTCVESSV